MALSRSPTFVINGHGASYKRNKSAQLKPYVTYLVSLTRFNIIWGFYPFFPKIRRWLDFHNKWPWGFCVMLWYCHAYWRIEYALFNPYVTYLVSLTQLNSIFSDFNHFLTNNWRDIAALTFVIDDHGAAVWRSSIATHIEGKNSHKLTHIWHNWFLWHD